MLHFKISILLFMTILVQMNLGADVPEFPNMLNVVSGSYESRVEITVSKPRIVTKEDGITESYFVDEYHDLKNKRGTVVTPKSTYYYSSETQQVAIIRNKECTVHNMSDLPNNLVDQTYWDWLDKDNGILGPSAVVFKKLQTPLAWHGLTDIRGITTTSFKGPEDGVDLEFYFILAGPAANWEPASGNKYTVPVVVIAKGVRNHEGEDIKEDLQMDFVYFRPNVTTPIRYMIPRGIGCPGLIAPKNLTLPPVLDQFSFKAELIDNKYAEDHVKNVVEFYKVFFDGSRKIVQLEITDHDNHDQKINQIEDYNTGVMYRITKGSNQCSFGPIQNAMASKITSSGVGQLKTAAEFMGLNGDFYYLGKELYRGIYCNVWESVQSGAEFMKQPMYKAIFTYYFMSPDFEAVSEGDVNVNIPVALIIHGFNAKIPTKEPDIVLTYNLFAFDEEEVDVYLGEDMNIESCFEDESQKQYFMIHLESNEKSTKLAKENHAMFEIQSILGVIREARISPMRLAYLKIYYEPKEIGILGLLLNRPPFIAGFEQVDKQGFTPTVDMGLVETSQNEDECAQSCLNVPNYDCKALAFCESKEQCFVGPKGWTDKQAEKMKGDYNCAFYTRSVFESDALEEPLNETMWTLKAACDKKTFGIMLTDVDSQGKEVEVVFTPTKIDLGIEPFNWQKKSSSYRELFNELQLKGPEKSFTSYTPEGSEFEQPSSVEECYQSCVDDKRLHCATFSFCGNGRKRCMLSSMFIDPLKTSSLDEIESATSCNVYRRSDIQFFDETPGRVPMITGTAQMHNVETKEKCAFWCKSETEFDCRGFEFCDNSKTCVLQDVHLLDFNGVSDDQSKTNDCVHYSRKYSTEFVSVGRMRLEGVVSIPEEGMTFAECTKRCYDMRHDDVDSCTSINFCDTKTGYRCELNQMDLTQKGHFTNSTECQHYYTLLGIETEKQFPDPEGLVQKGYVTETEITQIANTFFPNSTSQAYLEYHDILGKRGRVHTIDRGERIEKYYFSNSKQTADIRINSCEVGSTIDEFGFFDKDKYIVGPSTVLFRRTRAKPVFNGITNVRGINVDVFVGIDAESNETITYYFKTGKWSDDNAVRLGIPLMVELKGKQITVRIDFITFRVGINSLTGWAEFMMPKGLGCKGLKSNGGRVLPLPTEKNIYTFEAEIMNPELIVKEEIKFISVDFDNKGKIAKFVIPSLNKKEKVQFIQDFTTGTEYGTFSNGTCQMKDIRNSWASDLPDGQVGPMVDGKQFLGLDGDYYYLGQEMYRTINCDVFEAVKENVHFFGIQMKRLVQTVHFMSPDFVSIWHGDGSLRVPVKIELNYIGSTQNAKPVKTVLNVFAFDDVDGQFFYEDTNIENCFTQEGQKEYFLIHFQSNEEAIKYAKLNENMMKLLALTQISASSGASYIRIPPVQILYGPDYLTVMGVLLDRPPIINEFSLYSEVAPAYKGQTLIKTINNKDACVKTCLKDDTCKGFTFCSKGSTCYLSAGDITDTKIWVEPFQDPGPCDQYFKTSTELLSTEPTLLEAMQNLQKEVNARNVTLEVYDARVKNRIMVAVKIDLQLKPFNWQDDDEFETVFTEKRLAIKKDKQTSMEVSGTTVGSAGACYKACIEEPSMSCLSFSYCKTNSVCRLSSVYLNSEDKNSKDQLEPELATSCAVYKGSSLKSFESYPGEKTPLQGYKSVPGIFSAAHCGQSCLTEEPCKGFEFCPTSKKCLLFNVHILDMETSPGTSPCTHYSKRYSVDYTDMGGHLLLTNNKEDTLQLEEMTFEECAKRCTESSDLLLSPCKSFNFCKYAGEGKKHTCNLYTKTNTDQGVVYQDDNTCSYNIRKEATPEKRDEDDSTRTTAGHFAGTAIGVMIFGICLGGALFLLYSYYKSRQFQNADGLAVRFIKA